MTYTIIKNIKGTTCAVYPMTCKPAWVKKQIAHFKAKYGDISIETMNI